VVLSYLDVRNIICPKTKGQRLLTLFYEVLCLLYTSPDPNYTEDLYLHRILSLPIHLTRFGACEFTLDDSGYDGWFTDIFAGYHCFYIRPVVTLLGMVSLFFQGRELFSRTSVGAISVVGFGSQAIIFALVGSTWTFRLPASRDFFKGLTPLCAYIKWLQLVGWATVDNLVFAFVQAILFCIAWNRRGKEGTAGETTRLLR
jgi:hypothetical protein